MTSSHAMSRRSQSDVHLRENILLFCSCVSSVFKLLSLLMLSISRLNAAPCLHFASFAAYRRHRRHHHHKRFGRIRHRLVYKMKAEKKGSSTQQQWQRIDVEY